MTHSSIKECLFLLCTPPTVLEDFSLEISIPNNNIICCAVTDFTAVVSGSCVCLACLEYVFFLFFFYVRQPCHQIFKSECCCKSSCLAEILCHSPELGCQVHTVRPCLMMLLCVHGAGLEDVVWGLMCVPALARGCVQNAGVCLTSHMFVG